MKFSEIQHLWKSFKKYHLYLTRSERMRCISMQSANKFNTLLYAQICQWGSARAIQHAWRNENSVEYIWNQGAQLEYDSRLHFQLIFVFSVALRNRAEWDYFKYLNLVWVRFGLTWFVEAKKTVYDIEMFNMAFSSKSWCATFQNLKKKTKQNLINDLNVEVFRMFLSKDAKSQNCT